VWTGGNIRLEERLGHDTGSVGTQGIQDGLILVFRQTEVAGVGPEKAFSVRRVGHAGQIAFLEGIKMACGNFETFRNVFQGQAALFAFCAQCGAKLFKSHEINLSPSD